LEVTAYYFQFAADQGNAAAQFDSGFCLSKGKGISIDFKGAAYYFQLAADQRIAAA
jgi:TPR repeat protein